MNTKLFLSLILATFLSFQLNAQCVNGTKSYPLYKEGASIVNDLDEMGKEIVRIEYDLIFTSKNTYRYLSPDWEYTFYTFGDEGVEDIDIYLYEYDDLLDEWTLVASDELDDYDALIKFRPDVYAEYRVEISVASFEDPYTVARYGLIVYHD